MAAVRGEGGEEEGRGKETRKEREGEGEQGKEGKEEGG